MTANQHQARALFSSDDTRVGYLGKLDAAGVSYTVEVLRVRGEHPHEREASSHVSVFVQGETVARFVETS